MNYVAVRGRGVREHVGMTSTDTDRPWTATRPTLRLRWVLTDEGLRMRWDAVPTDAACEPLALQLDDSALAA